jgi:ubiquinol-cytochrome c reductase cytochrome b subunit
VAAPGGRVAEVAQKVRGRLSTLMFADNVQKPTAEELHELEHQIASGPNKHGPHTDDH